MGSDGQQWIRKRSKTARQDHHVQGTCKYGGGNLMLWGCVTWLGVAQACEIDGNLDSAQL